MAQMYGILDLFQRRSLNLATTSLRPPPRWVDGAARVVVAGEQSSTVVNRCATVRPTSPEHHRFIDSGSSMQTTSEYAPVIEASTVGFAAFVIFRPPHYDPWIDGRQELGLNGANCARTPVSLAYVFLPVHPCDQGNQGWIGIPRLSQFHCNAREVTVEGQKICCWFSDNSPLYYS